MLSLPRSVAARSPASAPDLVADRSGSSRRLSGSNQRAESCRRAIGAKIAGEITGAGAAAALVPASCAPEGIAVRRDACAGAEQFSASARVAAQGQVPAAGKVVLCVHTAHGFRVRERFVACCVGA